MENGAEVKGEVVADLRPEVKEEVKSVKIDLITGEVRIKLDEKGGLTVDAPPNVVAAFAIIEAGKTYLMMQMQDAMRRANALRQPTIVRGDSKMMEQASKIFGGKPS